MPPIIRRGRLRSSTCSVRAAAATRFLASSPTSSAPHSAKRSLSKIARERNGALAALYVHHQPSDGYTLLMATNSPLSADPFIHKNLNYDPIKDFVPITRVGSFTLMLVVNAKLPIRSVKELVEYAKVHPGELSFASGNTAGIVGGHTLAKW